MFLYISLLLRMYLFQQFNTYSDENNFFCYYLFITITVLIKLHNGLTIASTKNELTIFD